MTDKDLAALVAAADEALARHGKGAYPGRCNACGYVHTPCEAEEVARGVKALAQQLDEARVLASKPGGER